MSPAPSFCMGIAVLAALAPEIAAEGESPPKSDAAKPWTFWAGGEMRFMHGDFETGHDVDIRQLSATVEARRGRLDFSMTQLYLETESTGTGSVSASPAGTPFFQGRGSPNRASRSDTFESRSGLGDTFLEAGVQAARQEDLGAGLRAWGGVKLPTADERKGLGTGETDVFLGVSATRWEGNHVGTLRLGKTFMGDPPGTEYRDPWDAALGVGRRFPREAGEYLEPRIWLRGREAVLPASSDPVELAGTLDYGKGKGLFTFELAFGLTEGAPEYSLALGAGLEF